MAKQYDELTFHDDFMFCKVLEGRPEPCRKLLELTLGHKVGELVRPELQKAIEILPDRKGVRFDVYVEGEDRKVYDVEMQNVNKDSLPKRTRYSQAMMDLRLLEKGRHYRELKASYVIFICRFNPFEKAAYHKYSFRNLCRQDPKIELGDETEKIFMCTEGSTDDISKEMQAFLKYVAEGIPSDSFTNELENAVKGAREQVEWRREYMNFQEMLEIEREEGREEGRLEGREEGRQEGREEGRKEEREKTEREKKRADAAEEEIRRLRKELEALRKEKGRLEQVNGSSAE